jgi:hypothetical protein
MSSRKKKWVFRGILFSKFPGHFHIEKVVYSVAIYLYMYLSNICGSGPGMQGGFFLWRVPDIAGHGK